MGLRAYARLDVPLHRGVVKSFMRRLRKVKVRGEMTEGDICVAVWAVGRMVERLRGPVAMVDDKDDDDNDADDNDDDDNDDDDGGGVTSIHPSREDGDNKLTSLPLTTPSHNGQISTSVTQSETKCEDGDLKEITALVKEAETMSYTLLNELFKRSCLGDEYSEGKRQQPLSVMQVGDILSSCVALKLDIDGYILEHISLSVQYEHEYGTRQSYTISDIARILWSLQRLRMSDQSEMIAALIRKFVHLLETDDSTMTTCDPKHLTMILRSVILLSPGTTIMQDTFSAVSPILLDPTFLLRCNEFEVSSFIWIMAKAHIYNKEVIYNLSCRMRDVDIISNCSPSSASRFLWSFTMLVESGEEDLVFKEVLFETFQALGGIMLSSQLTHTDISNTMWAMAKASYSLDMGIFDHLAEALSQDSMLERANTRQLSQALWACGKMIAWENPLRAKNGGVGGGTGVDIEMKFPPYIGRARKIASYLVTVRLDEMKPKDIAQSCWALGHLKINDHKMLYPLAHTAAYYAQKNVFNSQEIANIVWGLSKTSFRNEWLIRTLTRQLRHTAIQEQCTPQEASNILYALGTMNIRDDATFRYMNLVIMMHLSKATAQTIANSLWAHDRVKLDPPPQLLDTWLRERLDVMDLYLDNAKHVHVIE